MNNGLCFSNPFESVYNVYRRTLIANPLPLSTNQSTIHVLINKHIKGMGALNTIISTLQPKINEWNLPSELIRQCENCSRIIFHTALYNSYWLAQCPIHNLPLTTKCPLCHQRWPDTHQMHLRNCKCCGWFAQDKIYAERKKCNQYIAEKISPLIQIIEGFNKIEKLYSSGEIERPHIDLYHVMTPSILNDVGLLKEDISKIFKIHISPVQTHLIRQEELSEKELSILECQKRNADLHKIKLSVMRGIVASLSIICPRNHTFTTSIVSLNRPCIYCEAFFAWIKLIFEDNLPDPCKIPNVFPVTPPLFIYLESGHKVGVVPFIIQKIIFEKDLMNSFTFILKELRRYKMGIKFKSIHSDLNKDKYEDFYMTNNLFSNYLFFKLENEIYFTFDTSKIIDHKNLEFFNYNFGDTYCTDRIEFLNYGRSNENLLISNPDTIKFTTRYFNRTTYGKFFSVVPKYFTSSSLAWRLS